MTKSIWFQREMISCFKQSCQTESFLTHEIGFIIKYYATDFEICIYNLHLISIIITVVNYSDER